MRLDQWGDFDLQIRDKEAIKYLLKELDAFDRNKIIKQGLRDAGGLFLKRGRARLKARMKNPKGITGNLLRSMTLKVKRYKPGALVGFKRPKGALVGFKYPKGSHAWLIDEGTDERQSRYRRTGRVKPTYFWTDTRNNDQSAAWDILINSIEKAVNRINNRQS